MRTPVALPPILKGWSSECQSVDCVRKPVDEGRGDHCGQTTSLEERLAKEATQLRKQAQGTPPGVERDLLLRKARRAETASTYDRVAGLGDKHQDKF